ALPTQQINAVAQVRGLDLELRVIDLRLCRGRSGECSERYGDRNSCHLAPLGSRYGASEYARTAADSSRVTDMDMCRRKFLQQRGRRTHRSGWAAAHGGHPGAWLAR